MLQYKCDDQGGPQPPKPPGTSDLNKPTKKEEEKKDKQHPEKS